MIKLGSVSYINALPLTHFLDPKEFEIIHLPPAQLFSLLKNKKVDAALLPIVNYFENRDLYLIPEIAIAAKGAVQSVKLFLNSIDITIENLNNIYLDKESRTSQLLLKTLLKYRYNISLEDIHFNPDLNDPSVQAKLLIGDKALFSLPVISAKESIHNMHLKSPYLGRNDNLNHDNSIDLGELWWSWLKKPFVFAAWMTNNPYLSNRLSKKLKESRDAGLERINEIIQTLSSYPSSLLNEYFTKSLHYYMGEKELEGIQTFYQYLKTIEGYSDELDFRFIS